MIKNISHFEHLIKQYREMQSYALHLNQVATASQGDFDAIYEACLNSNRFRPSQMLSEVKFLYNLIRLNQCKAICEIGTLLGGTAFIFSQAAPDDAKIVSVDINSTITRRQALRKLPKPGQKLRLIVGDSHSMAVEKRVRKEFQETGIDFLFIDGDHSLFGVINDFVRYSPLVKPGGIVAFHDINPDSFIKTGIKTHSYVGGVPYFWEMIKKSGYKTEEFIEDPNQDGFGIGIIYKE